MDLENAPDVSILLDRIITKLEWSHLKPHYIYSVRSQGSTARAYARIWGLSRIFQVAAGYKPTYVIEVISKYYDKLPDDEKTRVLIHELMHIPKTFSGALLSHKGRYHRINKREVEKWYKVYVKD
ncbi:MAG TPA: putative metallopeptidase [Candidatus Nitrosocosmicus sp.]|nr:putative metallopeptidase [Candidatus Nitrosocosmicus sp.]